MEYAKMSKTSIFQKGKSINAKPNQMLLLHVLQYRCITGESEFTVDQFGDGGDLIHSKSLGHKYQRIVQKYLKKYHPENQYDEVI